MDERALPTAAAVLACGEAEVGNELTRMSEPGEVSYLGEYRSGDDRTDALQCLQSLHLFGPRGARE